MKLLKTLSKKTNDNLMMIKMNALKFLLDDNILDLLSTKSSNTETRETYPCDNYDTRSKVFIELIKLNDEYKLDPNLMENLDLLKTLWKDHANVSLFKKNQIGGVREIYILDIISRLRFRILETLSKGFCLQSDNEMLTHPDMRSNFIDRHHFKCYTAFKGTKYRTLRWSGDMTNWANLLMMDYFKVMYSVLMPEHFGLISDILDTNTNKRLYAPKELLNSFLKHSESKLYDPNVWKFKQGFLGNEDNSFSKKHRPYVTNTTNMMQGILHYTSSLYHLVHMEMLIEQLIISFNRITNSEVIISHEVSSDDEGMLISFVDNDLKSHAKKLIDTFWSVKLSVDNIFGVRTSIEKSTLSINAIYEFNSIFYMVNNVISPAIKFIARALDDNPSETLKTRVSSLHSQLRQLRENGVDGYLTHCASICQLSVYSKNMGTWVMNWDNEDSPYRKVKLSSFGAYYVHPPWTSGLVTSDYDDWIECSANHDVLKTYIKYSIKDVLIDEDTGHSLIYRLWPKRKYQMVLKELGLSSDKPFLSNDRIFLMKYPQDSNQLKLLFSNYATNPSIAKSFSWMTRNSCVQLSAFCQWGIKFENKSYRQVVMNPEVTEKEVIISDCFPESSQYGRFFEIEQEDYKFVKLEKEKTLGYHEFYPIVEKDKVVASWKKALDRVWFNIEYGSLDAELEATFQELKHMVPWLNENIKCTIDKSPFDNMLQIIMFFEATLKRNKPFTLMSSGRFPSRSPIESIIKYNTRRGYKCYIQQTNDVKSSIKLLSLIETRFSLWSDIMRVLPEDHVTSTLTQMMDDINSILVDMTSDELKEAYRTSSLRQRQFLHNIFAIFNFIGFEEFIKLYPGELQFYLEPQKMIEGKWVGNGQMILHAMNSECLVKVVDSKVVELTSRIDPVQWEKFLIKTGLSYSTYKFNYIESDIKIPNEQMSLHYHNGFKVSCMNGYSQRFGIDAYPHVNDLPLLVDCVPHESIEKYFQCKSLFMEDVKALVESKDPISQSLCLLIKELRKSQIPGRLRERMFAISQQTDFKVDLFESVEELLLGFYEEEQISVAEMWEGNLDDFVNLGFESTFVIDPQNPSGSYNPSLLSSIYIANQLVRTGIADVLRVESDDDYKVRLNRLVTGVEKKPRKIINIKL
jgi:hypothetical protein